MRRGATRWGLALGLVAAAAIVGEGLAGWGVLQHPARAGREGWRAAPPASSRFDVVLIVTDDQAWHQLQFMPRTNARIGNAGVRFTRAYVSVPDCCPSRASIFTGLYSHNHGVLGNKPPLGGAPRFDDRSTLATWLHEAGYRTGLFGKYLNSYFLLEPWPYVPPGWDEWHAIKINGYYNYTMVENGVEVRYGHKPEDYSTDVLAADAVAFIRSTPRSKPLFVYLTPTAPHQPAWPAAADSGSFADLDLWRPPNYDEADVSDKPAWVRALPPISARHRQSMDDLYRRQAETLQAVDRAVAAIVDALTETGRLSTTALVFTSDNGYSLGAHRWESKFCVYEECVRVPLLIRAPGAVPRTDESLVLNVDLAPTIAEWAGISPPGPVDGRSLVPLLADPGVAWRDAILLEYLARDREDAYTSKNFQAVRTARYVYAEYFRGDRELYDLTSDPYQLVNVVDDPGYATVVANLRRRLANLRAR